MKNLNQRLHLVWLIELNELNTATWYTIEKLTLVGFFVLSVYQIN